MRNIYHIIIANGVPYIQSKDYNLKGINRKINIDSINQKHDTTKGTRVPGKFTRIIDHSTNRPIILECKKCEDIPLKNVVYYINKLGIDNKKHTTNSLNNSLVKKVMRIPCFYIGMDIDTGETWCMNYDGIWYKEYVMTYSDEKYATSYINVCDNKPSIIEYHMPRYINEAVVKGTNDSVYNIFVKYIGKDINTGKLMASNYNNHWFEVISTNPENPIKYNMDFNNNKKPDKENKIENPNIEVNNKSFSSLPKKYIFAITTIYANMAKWIYYQDPINIYTNFSLHANYIPNILHEFYLKLISNACKLDSSYPGYTFYYYEFTKDELKNYLKYIVFEYPTTKELFKKLNLSYNELRKGLNINDSNSTECPNWEDDFIDLDALINNVVRDCIRDSKDAE